MNKIIITGASGFIGSHLVKQLLEDGVSRSQLRLLIHPDDSLKNLPDTNFDIVRADIRNPIKVKQALKGVTTIYHLAAKTVRPGTSYAEYAEVNVNGTQNLLNACLDRKIQKFVLFSSIAVYGLPAYVGEIKNWNESQIKFPKEEYGESKLEAERRLLNWHAQTGNPYAIIRPTTVYGPADHQGILELYKAVKNHYFIPIGDGQNLMDYVFVTDLVKGAIQAQKSKLSTGDYILGCGKPITFKHIYTQISRSINVSVPRLYLPRNIAMVISYPIAEICKLLNIRAPLFPNRVRIITTDAYWDITNAKKHIKYNPSTTFAQGAEITGKWLIANNIL